MTAALKTSLAFNLVLLVLLAWSLTHRQETGAHTARPPQVSLPVQSPEVTRLIVPPDRPVEAPRPEEAPSVLAPVLPSAASPEVVPVQLPQWVVKKEGHMPDPLRLKVDVDRYVSDWPSVPHLISRLQDEGEPDERLALIEEIGKYYVQSNTLGAIEWALALPIPQEQETAIKSINENAFVGIGAALQVNDEGLPMITVVLPGSAAALNGVLKSSDVILGIQQAEGEILDMKDMPLADVVDAIRGKPGTTVQLLIRSGDGSSKTVEINRQMILMGPEPLFPR